MTKLPASGALRFANDYPAIWETYTALGKSVSEAGDIDARTRRLLKIALAVGANSEGAVHSHVRQAREEGISDADVRQVVLLAITTLGFPAAMAAYSWVNDILISPADSRTLDERRAWHAIGHRAGLVTPHLTDSRHWPALTGQGTVMITRARTSPCSR